MVFEQVLSLFPLIRRGARRGYAEKSALFDLNNDSCQVRDRWTIDRYRIAFLVLFREIVTLLAAIFPLGSPENDSYGTRLVSVRVQIASIISPADKWSWLLSTVCKF